MMMSRLFAISAALVFVAGLWGPGIVSAAPGDALDPAPVRVPSAPPSGQSGGVSARAADGDYVVIWTNRSFTGGESDYTLFGRAFETDGTPRGPQFPLTGPGPKFLSSQAVAMDADGRFAAVWVVNNGRDEGSQVMLRRFAEDGAPLGPAVTVDRVRSRLANVTADIAMAADGRFVVLWSRAYDPILGRTVFKAQRYRANGTPAGLSRRVAGRLGLDLGVPLGNPINFPPRVAVKTLIAAPDVAMADNGDFVVAWAAGSALGITDVFDPSARTIYARRFRVRALLNAPPRVIDRVRHDSAESGSRPSLRGIDPQVAITPNGDEYVVAWSAPAPLDRASDVNFRRIGGGSGTVVRVAGGSAPKLDIADDGQFALAYFVGGAPGLLATVYGPNDEVLAPAFPVNGERVARRLGSVSSTANGDFLVTFDDADQNDDIAVNSVYTRRFAGQ